MGLGYQQPKLVMYFGMTCTGCDAGQSVIIGDDRLQQQGQGRVVPDSFTHGTSEQRYSWFKRGFDSGDSAQCNTFGETF